MVIMALDHVRDYFHAAANLFDPGDPALSALPIFFTRWITHFCAPAFSFLAGTSAFLIGRRKTKQQLSLFLLKRGTWLVIIEFTVVNFAWYFDIGFSTVGLMVIWSLGISMICLAALIHLPKRVLLVFCLVLIFGHNLLDYITIHGNILWSILHQQHDYPLGNGRILHIVYPLIPWMAIMGMGYYFGSYYNSSVLPRKRRKDFNFIGLAAILLFLILRFSNLYGEPKLFIQYESFSQNIISFLDTTKYPPSLLFVLMTLGIAFILIANTESAKGKFVQFISTFGRVPFFYYIIHLYLIHFVAMIAAQFSGAGWQKMILPTWDLRGYGFSLTVVYLVWVAVIVLLYPLCKWFDSYKQEHKEKWWLGYL